ncbi:MAG: ribonuclease H-like domain-containing protein [Lachnospiraceae bacterium]|nr:ribonuclease H-like domain-containing protein [Lachnospiraceae bacterium]
MKTIHYEEETAKFPGSEPFLSEDMLFTDIETLGFSAEKDPIYLIGTASLKEKSLHITLYLAETPAEEADILSAFLEELGSFYKIITFNGERFDLPFLKKRAEALGIAPEARQRLDADENATDPLVSIDLLRQIRQNKELLPLSHFNQTSIEAFLDVERKDEYDGGKLIPVYRRYAKTQDPKDEDLLLLHNFEDVKGMIRILPILSYGKLRPENLQIQDTDWDFEDGHLFVTCSFETPVPKPLRIQRPSFYCIVEEDRLKAALTLYSGTLKYFLPYPAQYIYLLREEIIVPKMLAATVPAEQKRPAKRDECYSAVNGRFLGFDAAFVRKHPELFAGEKQFRSKFDDDTLYIKTDPANTNEEFLRTCVGLLLRFSN